MHFVHIVFAVLCFLFLNKENVTAFQLRQQVPGAQPVPSPAQQEQQQRELQEGEKYETEVVPEGEEEDEDEDENADVENHTFVTLIDIVFTNGSKKTCTGAIIHDHVVITAAHCFITQDELVQPELTLSFVVLGTKKMFETGYEMYLPIERIVTHPNFKGWTADLSLLYTFAGMTSDKPGTIVPLAGERTSTPFDSNVTVFSWGQCADGLPEQIPGQGVPEPDVTAFPPGARGQDQDDDDEATRLRSVRNRASINVANIRKRQLRSGPLPVAKPNSRARHQAQDDKPDIVEWAPDQPLPEKQSRYLSSAEDDDDQEEIALPETRRSQQGDEYAMYRNWRRMGQQHNMLTVEVFGFVNAQTCKKLVERAVSALYTIKNKNEVLCYSSDGHYITVEDSGAPAVQRRKLVAVTVGGVQSDGEHVAVGMKMSCFCSWIVENIPDEKKEKMKCCKNCCDNKVGQKETQKPAKDTRFRNDYYRSGQRSKPKYSAMSQS